MADDRSDRDDQIPEADLVEQRISADPYEPADVSDLGSASDEALADPADLLEQLTPIGEGDEDYPRD